MRVAVVSNLFPPGAKGGAEIFASDLCEELGKRGFTIHVFTSSARESGTRREGSVTVHRFRSTPPALRLTSDFLGYNINPWSRGLVRALQTGRFDLIHIHNINSTVMLLPLLHALRGPVVCHVHDHWPVCYRGTLFDSWNRVPCERLQPTCCFDPAHRLIGRINLKFRSKLVGALESRTSIFIVPSIYMKDTLLKREFTENDKIEVLRLGVNLAAIPKRRDALVPQFVFAGRLVFYKNPRFIIELLARGKLPKNVVFKVLGDGPEISYLRSKAKLVGSNRLQVLGALPRMRVLDEMAHSRGLLVPSIIPENSPLSIYEALACGTPVACTSAGGAKELIQESGGGEVLNLEEGERWDVLLTSLLDDSTFEKYSERALDFAQRGLGIGHVADKVAKIYDCIVR